MGQVKPGVIKKPHQKYINRNGERVPGVTTVLNILNKPQLNDWFWEMGKANLDWKKVRDGKADMGTLAHLYATDYLQGIKTDDNDFTDIEIDKASNSAISFFEWYKQNPIEVKFIEKQMVSEEYQFGGTCDIYGNLNGVWELIDLKTGKDIYEDHRYQLAAYKQLLIENGNPVDKCRIINIGRNEDEKFKEMIFEDTEKDFQIFLHCLNIYNLRKKTK